MPANTPQSPGTRSTAPGGKSAKKRTRAKTKAPGAPGPGWTPRVPESERQRFSPEIRRAKILEVAKQVLLPNPQATLGEVAEAAGVTRQLVSLYFPGGGTGPLYAAMFDEYIAALPGILGEDLAAIGSEPEGIREATTRIVRGVLEWVERVGQPWVFSDGRNHPGSYLGERWQRLDEITAEMLMTALGKPKHPARVRTAIIAELRSTVAIARRMLEGEVTDDEAELIMTERFVALYTVVIPALEAA